MIKLSTYLTEARDLIAKGWMQKHLYGDANKEPISDSTDSRIACFCSMGALCKVRDSLLEDGMSDRKETYNMRHIAEWALDEAVGGGYVTFNDTEGRTKEEVLAMFDKAIEKAKQDEAANT